MAKKDRLIAWLNDAYAMEEAQVPILKNHADDASEYPDVAAQDSKHLEETRRHAEMVKGCIERLGGSPSTAKATMSKAMGAIQSVATGPFRDEVVKNVLSDFASENLEIASYQALITAAREVGDEETARVCEAILRDEEVMANWLQEKLPEIVKESLAEAE